MLRPPKIPSTKIGTTTKIPFHHKIQIYIYIFQRFCSVASKCCSQLVYYENSMYLHTSKTITKLTSSFETTWCSITFGMCLKQPRKKNPIVTSAIEHEFFIERNWTFSHYCFVVCCTTAPSQSIRFKVALFHRGLSFASLKMCQTFTWKPII